VSRRGPAKLGMRPSASMEFLGPIMALTAVDSMSTEKCSRVCEYRVNSQVVGNPYLTGLWKGCT
jgi:hypothetical protein